MLALKYGQESAAPTRPRGGVGTLCGTYISWTHDSADLLHRVKVWAQTTVHGEDLLVNDGRNRQAVKAICEGLPQLDVIPTLALVVETVDTVDGRAFVVASQDEEVLRVLDLVREEEADSLQRLLAAVDVVSKEQVIRLGREATILKEPQKVIVLSMDVAANLNRSQGVSQGTGLNKPQWHVVNDFQGKWWFVCHTLMGASSSSRMGWEMNISRALVQR